jgi:ketosteroid isomerase-like protein
MKRLMIKAIAVSLLFIISVVSIAQTKDEMKTIVARMNQELIDLAKAGRFEAMGKYYDMTAISMPNYMPIEVGYQLILKNNLGRKNGGYKILDGKKTTQELIMGVDMMVDIGAYSLTATFPGLAKPKITEGKYLNVWKKDKEGAWRIVAETWNADRNPNAPPSTGQVQPGAPKK